MDKVVSIQQAFTRIKLEYNQCFIDQINTIEPDSIHMIYEKDVGIIEQLGALQYLSQCAFFDYVEDDLQE